MSEYTRGPWVAESPPAGCVGNLAVWSTDGMLIARIVGLAEFDYANARLIAAAPDLLAACKAAFAMLVERGDPFAGSDWELGHRLSAAIGKATGKEKPGT